MRQLLVLQGLPGSGKTTWAREQVEAARIAAFGPKDWEDPNWVQPYPAVARVNRDDIRAELVETGGWEWSQENEKQDVLPIRDGRIARAFAKGAQTVIVDDTNFGRKTITHLRDLAKQCDAQFVLKRFDTPVVECIRRDSLRTGRARVGDHVIRRMAREYGIERTPEPTPDLVPYVAKFLAPRAIICDLDGTLSLFKEKGHRGPYNQELCAQDDCHPVIKRLLEMYYRFMGYQIIYLSGRSDQFKSQTEEFLRKHHCPPGELFMRKAGDTRTDWIIKYELFDAHIREQFNVDFALDDRDQCVKLWRSIGLNCWQVAEGNF